METFHGLCLCGKITFTNNFHEKLHQHASFYITLSAKFSFNQSERKLEFDLTFPQSSSWLAVGHLNKLFIRRDGKTPHVVQFNFGLTFLFTSIEPRRWEIISIAWEKYSWLILKNTAWSNNSEQELVVRHWNKVFIRRYVAPSPIQLGSSSQNIETARNTLDSSGQIQLTKLEKYCMQRLGAASNALQFNLVFSFLLSTPLIHSSFHKAMEPKINIKDKNMKKVGKPLRFSEYWT